MSNLALNVQLQFVTHECINCGVTFAITKMLDDWRHKDHQTFYCPNGHGQAYYGESDAEREKRLRLAEESRHKATLARLNEAQENARIAETTVAKLRKRIKAGVCPCCKKTFRQLSLHMKHKHPEYAA